MRTLLGKKFGQLTLDEQGSALSGVIEILCHCNELKGIILKNEKCKLDGELITPLQSITCKAEGFIIEKIVDLNLITEKDTLSLKGKIENDEMK
jgi:hypothetical protein